LVGNTKLTRCRGAAQISIDLQLQAVTRIQPQLHFSETSQLIRPALAGRPTAWFSPTYRLLSDAWRQLSSTLHPVIIRNSDSEHRLELRGGGTIEAWSLDNPDSGRGRACACVVVDEAALVVNLRDAWEGSIRPMLADHRGSAFFLSTPKGTTS
jgi:hypothetical protein